MNKNIFYFINSVTFLSFITIISLLYVQVFNEKQISISPFKEDDPTRNERSTPRTFILPATPAVADEQERRIGLYLQAKEIQRCMLKLYDKGYKDIGKFNDYSNFKITVSIIKFQRNNNLEVTGKLNKQTKTKLGCL